MESKLKNKNVDVESRGSRAIETVSNEELARLKAAIQFAEKIRNQVNDELRARIEQDRMPGWKLRNTGSEREVVDPNGMWRAFRKYFELSPGFTAEGYDACRVISWGELEEYIQNKVIGSNQRDAKELVREISSPYVIETPKAKSPQPLE